MVGLPFQTNTLPNENARGLVDANHAHSNCETSAPALASACNSRDVSSFEARGNARFLILAAFLGALLIFGLGRRGLNEPDEGRYAEMASEMAKGQTGWWEPKLSGYGHYDKPPLLYWTAALSFKVLGYNESAARMPSVLGAVLTLLGVGWAAARLYGRDTSWWTVLICGTLAQFWLLARFLTPDMLLTGWCTLAIAAWAESRHRQSAWGFWLLSLFFWALAWWTKATAALVPLLGLAVSVWVLRDERGKKALRLPLLLAGILVLGSPWYLSMIWRHEELVAFFFGRELAGRVFGHVTGRTGPIYYYLALGLVAWLPWWPLGVALGILQKRRGFQLDWTKTVQSAGWESGIVVTGLLVFSIISSKLPTYSLPLAPWIAVLLARGVIQLQALTHPARITRWIRFGLGAYALLLVAANIAAPRFEAALGLNSSMRPVAEALKRHGAQTVLVDRYWPGMEFYFGESVYYLVAKNPRQLRPSARHREPLGVDHFWPIDRWHELLSRGTDFNLWIARYAKAGSSPLLALEQSDLALQRMRVGDFVLSQIAKAKASDDPYLTNVLSAPLNPDIPWLQERTTGPLN